jgi:hypothetical protein
MDVGPHQFNGCFTHPIRRIERYGNSTYDGAFIIYYKKAKAGNKFHSRGRKPLDLIVLKQFILTQFSLNSLFDLELAVMVMLAVNDYLREDELGHLERIRSCGIIATSTHHLVRTLLSNTHQRILSSSSGARRT